ncbi:hypothetical protein [Microbacterium stercoris]|uniref:Uncharacterized protein n=1 Tax=Microbacterium stercoris TaxID=2820289 RepID=A0A939QTB2_9MICO|nr:hypothetical protein [Microbacterium stercoris]MBO3664793.1 hypothetical protein [Microbacterium stercoris]
MAFRPLRPTPTDYAQPIPDWLLDALSPRARELDNAVKTAHEALLKARAKAASTASALRELSTADGPRAMVKRTDWDKADDAARAAVPEAEAAERAYDRATRARFEFIYGTDDEPGALDSEEFLAKVEPLFAAASRAARSHLDALVAALTERDAFASAMGRVIAKPGGWFGLAHATRDISAYIDAGPTDEDEDAWRIVNATLGEAVALTSTKLELLRKCQAIREDESIPASAKAQRYRAVLAHYLPQEVTR